MAHSTQERSGESSPPPYRCRRCGAESEDPRALANGYCAICGCFECELDAVPYAEARDAELPAA